MSKTKLLLDLASDMRSLADSLSAVAEAIGMSDGEIPQDDGYSIPDEQTEASAAKETEAVKDEPFTIDGEPMEVDKVSVRRYLANKSRAGFREEVKALLKKHGGDTLGDVPESHYKALLKDAEGLKDAS